MNKITILGSGTSTGVPILGCNCQVCQSNDPRNKRFRTSALIQTSDSKNILIDASPDLRTQLLKEKTQRLDAVIITHDHADHTHGMDDLRPYSFKREHPLPVFADENCGKDLKRKFSYIFDRHNYFQNKAVLGGGIPMLDLHVAREGVNTIAENEFTLFSLPHGHEKTLAILHSKMAYITDVRVIPENVLQILCDARLELLVIDCLRPTPHQTHLHLDLTLKYIARIKPHLAVLTHLGHEWDYLGLSAELLRQGVKNAFPATDGQSFLYS